MEFLLVLDCEQIQAAISARLDGEPTGIPDDVIDAHIAVCPECRRYQEKIMLLHETFPLAAASPGEHAQAPKYLTDSILDGVEPQLRQRAASRALGLALTRVALCLLAVFYVGWAIVLLTQSARLGIPNNSGEVPGTSPNEQVFMAEAAVVRISLACGLIFGAWWPRLVSGMLPIMGTFLMFSAGLMMRDLIVGQATQEQWISLVTLAISLIVLLWSWLNNYGIDAFRRYWGTLGSGSAGP